MSDRSQSLQGHFSAIHFLFVFFFLKTVREELFFISPSNRIHILVPKLETLSILYCAVRIFETLSIPYYVVRMSETLSIPRCVVRMFETLSISYCVVRIFQTLSIPCCVVQMFFRAK